MENIFSALAKYIWIIIFLVGWGLVPFFLYKSYQNKRRREWYESQDFRLIKISVPKENEKGPLAAEQMFASLHGIFRPHQERKREGSMQEHISFEIASSNERITFYVWLPTHLKDFVEGQIYAQYPKAEFEEAADYTERDFSDYHIVGTEIIFNKSDVFPIKTFMNFEEVDPLSGITSVLAKIDDPGEDIWIQILAKPMDDTWQERGHSYIAALRDGKSVSSGAGSKIMSGSLGFMKDLAKAAVVVPEAGSAGSTARLKSGDEAKIKAIEEKVSKLGYSVKIRVGYITKKANLAEAKIKLRSVVGAFKQFNTVNLNGFQAGPTVVGEKFLEDYKSRIFPDDGFTMNIEEIASIFHLPNNSVETPRIGWTGSTKGAPPETLPIVEDNTPITDIASFAETNFRHRKYKFGIKTDDRRRHMYIMGKTGVGKTNMMENMIISDINAGHGIAVVDPHGELVSNILEYIPPERYKDVILFDPADSEYPIAFNPLETVDPDQKQLIASGLISIFNKIWKESWGPRLEYILRNTILSLLDYPGSTLLGIQRILVDKDYRRKVIEKVEDPVVYDFWTKEFEQYNEKTRVDAILPIQNKVGQFLSSPTIRNIVGQPKSKIDIRDIMDNGKILLVRLSQGQIGEDNTALLGAMMITKMQLAAMSRVDIPEAKRRDFYLYVDEFQNFATDSFAKILSEARKYRLNLTVANQYISQLSETVRDAIFGNIGSIVCFRVGANDSKFLAKEFEPVFEENDLVNLDKYHIYIKLSIDGITGDAFSAKTLKVPDEKLGDIDKILQLSHEKYASKKDFVVEMISKWSREQIKANSAIQPLSSSNEARNNSVVSSDSTYDSYSAYLDDLKAKTLLSDNTSKGNDLVNNHSVSRVEGGVSRAKSQVSSSEHSSDVSEAKNNDSKHSKLKELTSQIIKNQKPASSRGDNSSGMSNTTDKIAPLNGASPSLSDVSSSHKQENLGVNVDRSAVSDNHQPQERSASKIAVSSTVGVIKKQNSLRSITTNNVASDAIEKSQGSTLHQAKISEHVVTSTDETDKIDRIKKRILDLSNLAPASKRHSGDEIKPGETIKF